MNSPREETKRSAEEAFPNRGDLHIIVNGTLGALLGGVLHGAPGVVVGVVFGSISGLLFAMFRGGSP